MKKILKNYMNGWIDSIFNYELIETKQLLMCRNFYFKLQYFGNTSCHYQAKIISKEETDNIINQIH